MLLGKSTQTPVSLRKVQAAFVIWKWLFLMTLNKILMLSSLDYQNNNNTWQFYNVFQKNTVRLWLTKVVAPLERHLNTVQTSVKPLIPWRGGWVSLSTQIKWLMVTTKALTVRAKRVKGSWFLGYQSLWVFESSGKCKLQSQRKTCLSPKFSALRFQVLVCILHMTIAQQSTS